MGMPNLARVEAIHVRVPFRRPLLDATGEYTHRRVWLLRLVDRDGRQGVGEAAPNPVADDTTTGALAGLMRELVPALAAGRWPEFAELAAQGEPGRAAMAAIEGAAGALGAAGRADGRAAGRPNSSPSAAVAVSATLAFGGPDAAAEAGAQAIELGFRTLELRAGYERTTDQLVERLRALRAAVGSEPNLRIDAGGAWDLDTATERLTEIAPYRIEFVAQPLAAWNLTGHAALRDRTRVPIALDQSIDSEGSAREALAEGAAHVLIVKPARAGGAAATLRIAQAAAAAHVHVVLATYFETGVGIAAALRIAASLPGRGETAHALATAGLLVHDLLAEPISIQYGRMTVPESLELDEREVNRYSIERIRV